MGESADNGPDNMLLVDGKVVNIDLTGCRYDRSENFTDKFSGKTRQGWKTVFSPQNIKSFQDNLLSTEVFQDRYLKGLGAVHEAVISVIKEELGQDKSESARQNILAYISSLDPKLSAASVEIVTQQMQSSTPKDRWPDVDILKGVTKRAEGFFVEAIAYTNSLSSGQSIGFSMSK